MNAHVSKEQIALLMPNSLSHYADEPRFDDASREGGIFARIAAGLSWIINLPRRQAVLAELAQLSDHELTDIGLNRNELSRVFDPSFARLRSAGN